MGEFHYIAGEATMTTSKPKAEAKKLFPTQGAAFPENS
jgi:hypothetical protein